MNDRPSTDPYERRRARYAQLEVELSHQAVTALNAHATRLGMPRLTLLSEIIETVLSDGLVTAVLDR